MPRSIRIAFCIAALILSELRADEPLRIRGETMGTYYVVTIDSPAVADAKSLKQTIDAALTEFSRQFSTWDKTSEISRFNATESNDWFEVSPPILHVLKESQKLYEISRGAFDPTVAPLIELWGFGAQKRSTIPTQTEIDSARERVGLNGIEFRDQPASVRKSPENLQLNFSAIAPGYAIDLVAELLRQQGFQSFLVDIGGEAQAGAAKSSGAPWRVAVESPLGGLHKVIELQNSCMATSGDYRNFFVADGQKFSHVIDPTTGRPVPDPPASVSVIHQSSMSADAWATTMLVLGVDKGMALAEKHNVDVMFLQVSDNHELIETSRGRFAEVSTVAPAAVK